MVLDIGRIGVAAMGIGLAQGALDQALAYARERRAFGQPISSFQTIQAKLADLSTEIEAARLLTHKAAWLKDNGRPFTLTAAQAKLKSGRLAVRAADEAVQIHGGYGYIEEYPVCRFYRDAKILTIGEGTDEVQQMVIARALARGVRRLASTNSRWHRSARTRGSSATAGVRDHAAHPDTPANARLQGEFLLAGRVTVAKNIRGERVGQTVTPDLDVHAALPGGMRARTIGLVTPRGGGTDQLVLRRALTGLLRRHRQLLRPAALRRAHDGARAHRSRSRSPSG